MAVSEFEPDAEVRTRKFAIGCVGAGMIMAECHLAAYKEAGFKVVAIASRTRANASKVAERWGIPRVHDTPEELIEDPGVEILDLAFPPDQQPGLIRHALKQPHVKGILAQKPLALSLEEAVKLRDEAAAAGKVLSVNQNMRAPGGLSLRTLQRRTYACYRGFAIDGSSIDALHTQRQTVTRCGLQPVRPKWCSSVLQRIAAPAPEETGAEAHPEPPEGTSGLYADLLRVAVPTPLLLGPSSCDRVISLCGANHARHTVNVSSTRAKVDRMPRG